MRRRSTVKTALFAAIVTLSGVFGNLFLSIGLRSGEANLSYTPSGLVKFIFSPLILLGVTLLILWLLSRMTLLSWADLSFVLPVTSFGYVMTVLLGRYFLAESVSAWRWTGTVLITLGSVLVGITPHQTTGASSTERAAQ